MYRAIMAIVALLMLLVSGCTHNTRATQAYQEASYGRRGIDDGYTTYRS